MGKRGGDWSQSWQGRGRSWSVFSPSGFAHLGTEANTVRHCSMAPLSSRAWGGLHLLPGVQPLCSGTQQKTAEVVEEGEN